MEIDLRYAKLSGVDLSGSKLHDFNLRYANLRNARLVGADLRNADLRFADLTGSDLTDANLSHAILGSAILSCANLTNANLSYADLKSTILNYTNLNRVNLTNAKNVPYIPMVCPDTGSFTAWKKSNGYIVKLLIPEDAVRSSATSRKCRANKAMVLSIENLDGSISDLTKVSSAYDETFVYEIGKTVVVNDFDNNRFNECAPGIHFFINRQEAVDY